MMFNLTQKERMVLLFIATVIFAGCVLQVIVKHSEGVRNFLTVTQHAGDPRKVDLNSATLQQLTKVPYIGTATARAIIHEREQSGQFYSVEDLKNVKGIGQRKLELIKGYVCVADGAKP